MPTVQRFFFLLPSSCRKDFVKCNTPYPLQHQVQGFSALAYEALDCTSGIYSGFILLETKRSLETGSKEPSRDCGQYKTGDLTGSVSSITVEYHFQTVTQPRMNRGYSVIIWESLLISSCPAGSLKSRSFPVTLLSQTCPWLTPSTGVGLAPKCQQACT